MAKTEAGKQFLKSLGTEFYETKAASAFSDVLAKSLPKKAVETSSPQKKNDAPAAVDDEEAREQEQAREHEEEEDGRHTLPGGQLLRSLTPEEQDALEKAVPAGTPSGEAGLLMHHTAMQASRDAMESSARHSRLSAKGLDGAAATELDVCMNKHIAASFLHQVAAKLNPGLAAHHEDTAASHIKVVQAGLQLKKGLPATAVSMFESTLEKSHKAKLGSGKRFKAIEEKAEAEGEDDPAAVAAAIGRKKYGAKKMAKLAAAGRHKHTSKAINFYLDKLEKSKKKSDLPLPGRGVTRPDDLTAQHSSSAPIEMGLNGLTGKITRHVFSVHNKSTGKKVGGAIVLTHDEHPVGAGAMNVPFHDILATRSAIGRAVAKRSPGISSVEWDERGNQLNAITRAGMWDKDRMAASVGLVSVSKNGPKLPREEQNKQAYERSMRITDEALAAHPDTANLKFKKSLGAQRFEDVLQKSPRRKYKHPFEKYPGMPPEIIHGWRLLTGKTATGPDPMKSKSGVTAEGKFHNWTSPDHPLHAAKIAFDWMQSFTKTDRYGDTKYNQHSTAHKQRLERLNSATSGIKRKAELQQQAVRDAQAHMERQGQHGAFHTPHAAIAVARANHMENAVGRSYLNHTELGHISDAVRSHPLFAHAGEEIHHRMENFENYHEDAADAHHASTGSYEGYNADATNIHPRLLAHMSMALGDSKNKEHASTFNTVHAAHKATKAHPDIGAIQTDNRKKEPGE